jgi:hypothetical protein
MYILIDPPVRSYSPPEKIRDWIAELEQMRLEHAGDAEAVDRLDQELECARKWLGEGRAR